MPEEHTKSRCGSGSRPGNLPTLPPHGQKAKKKRKTRCLVAYLVVPAEEATKYAVLFLDRSEAESMIEDRSGGDPCPLQNYG